MDKILEFFAYQIKNLFDLLTSFKIPFGDTDVSFILILSALFMMFMFVKFVRTMFDSYIEIDESFVRNDARTQIKNRVAEQKQKDKVNKMINRGHMTSKEFRDNRDLIYVQNRKRGS